MGAGCPVGAEVHVSSAGRGCRSGGAAGGVRGHGVRAGVRMCVAVSAADVRGLVGHRAPPVHRVDRGWAVAQAAPGGAGRARRPGASWRGRLRSSMPRRCGREKEGSLTGPGPVDRGKRDSEPRVLSEAQGLSLAVAVSGANLHDSQTFKPLILGIPAVRSRRGPQRTKPLKAVVHEAEDPCAPGLRRARRTEPPTAPMPPGGTRTDFSPSFVKHTPRHVWLPSRTHAACSLAETGIRDHTGS
ncbi:hypothetical protein GA0115243_103135 [Streptomyces sp. ScaeMP-e83]|nr:hypothetical protein GA0115243_103135 [Streptomyces sp. ScaeMP-e83]